MILASTIVFFIKSIQINKGSYDLPKIKTDSLIVAIRRSAYCQQTKEILIMLQPRYL